MLVVRLQGVFRVAKEYANIVGVVPAGVEIGVVADLQREMHAHLADVVETYRLQGSIGLEFMWILGIDLEDLLEVVAHSGVFLAAQGSEGVERGFGGEHGRLGELRQRREAAVRSKDSEVKRFGPNRNRGPWGPVAAGGDYTERDIVEAEVRVGGYGEPGFRPREQGVKRHGERGSWRGGEDGERGDRDGDGERSGSGGGVFMVEVVGELDGGWRGYVRHITWAAISRIQAWPRGTCGVGIG